MTKLVSILMPLYNAEKWLSETIESVLSQTFDDWELIIVDDGSTDNSLAIAQSFANNDKRIKVYKQENKGACAARNKAFELSKGDYIQYLDADDLLSKNKIELQLKALEEANDKNAITNCTWEKFHKKIGDLKASKQLIDKSYDEPVNWLIDSWLIGGHGAVMAWLTPRCIIEKIGAWNESLAVNQDGEFFCRVLLQASQIVFVEGVNVYYRMDNPDSVSQKKKSRNKALSHLNSLLLYEKHLKEYLNDDLLKKAIVKNYISYLSQFDRYYPELSYKAWARIDHLGEEIYRKVVNRYGNKVTKLLGFRSYLKLARIKSTLFNLMY